MASSSSSSLSSTPTASPEIMLAGHNEIYFRYLLAKVFKKTTASGVHTHTWFHVKNNFSNDRVAQLLSVSDETEFLKQYYAYISNGLKLIPPTENNPTPFIEHNEITEKVQQRNTKLYFDIDIDAETAHLHMKTSQNVYEFWSDVRRWVQDIVHDAFDVDADVVFAFRLFYKCHLHVPEIVLTALQAKAIAKSVYNKMKTKYPWVTEKVVDQSVYSSGLRMLYSHKYGMGKRTNGKPSNDQVKHTTLFPNLQYREWYQVAKLVDRVTNENEEEEEDDDESKINNKKIDDCIVFNDKLTLSDLKMCSIHTSDPPTVVVDKKILIRKRSANTINSNNNNNSEDDERRVRRHIDDRSSSTTSLSTMSSSSRVSSTTSLTTATGGRKRKTNTKRKSKDSSVAEGGYTISDEDNTIAAGLDNAIDLVITSEHNNHQNNEEEGKEDLPKETCNLIKKYLETELPLLNVYPKIKSIYRYVNTGITIVDLMPFSTKLQKKLKTKKKNRRHFTDDDDDDIMNDIDDDDIYNNSNSTTRSMSNDLDSLDSENDDDEEDDDDMKIDDDDDDDNIFDDDEALEGNDDDDDDDEVEIDEEQEDIDNDEELPPACFFGNHHDRVNRGVPTHYVIFNCKGAFLRCWACNQRISPGDVSSSGNDKSGVDVDMRMMSDESVIDPKQNQEEHRQMQNNADARRLYSYEIPNLTPELHNLVIPKDSILRFIYLLHEMSDSAIGNYIVNIIDKNYVYSPYGSLKWYRYEAKNHCWAQRPNIIPDITTTVGGPVTSRLRRDYEKWLTSSFYTNLGEDLQQYLKKRYLKLMNKVTNVTEMMKIESNYIGPALLDRWRETVSRETEMNGGGVTNIGQILTRFNSVPTVLACTNGVFDLEQKRLRRGRPEDWNTFTTGNKYKPYEKHPEHLRKRLEEILSQIFTNPEHREYVLYVFAKALNGYCQSQEFIFLSGKGANGKSVTCKLIEYAVGDYAGTLPIINLTGKQAGAGAATPEIADIVGKRYVFLHEPNRSDKLNLSLIKLLTGGDTLRARKLYSDPIDFTLQATMFMLTNDIPNIEASSTDNGAWRRIKDCSFESKFCENPSKNPAKREFKTNPNLQKELKVLAPVFLALLIEKYIQYSDTVLPVPELFQKRRERIIYDNDIYTQFFNSCLKVKEPKNDNHENDNAGNNNANDEDNDIELNINNEEPVTTDLLWTQLLTWTKLRTIPKSRLHYSTFQDALANNDKFILDENDHWNVTIVNVMNNSSTLNM